MFYDKGMNGDFLITVNLGVLEVIYLCNMTASQTVTHKRENKIVPLSLLAFRCIAHFLVELGTDRN